MPLTLREDRGITVLLEKGVIKGTTYCLFADCYYITTHKSLISLRAKKPIPPLGDRRITVLLEKGEYT